MESESVLNDRELLVFRELRDAGFEVLRNGAPDFLTYRRNGTLFMNLKAVEVKSEEDDLSGEQKVYREILQQLGIPYEVRVVAKDAKNSIVRDDKQRIVRIKENIESYHR